MKRTGASAAVVALLVSSWSAPPAVAAVSPDIDRVLGTKVGDFPLEAADAEGRARASTLHAEAAGRWLIVQPFYVSCGGTCSPMTDALKAAVSGLEARPERPDFGVLSLSISPKDGARDLGRFASAWKLPARWRVARMESGPLHGFLDQVGFVLFSAGGGEIDHPDAVVLLAPDLTVRRLVARADLTADALLDGMRPVRWPWTAAAAILFLVLGFVFAVRTLVLRRVGPPDALQSPQAEVRDGVQHGS